METRFTLSLLFFTLLFIAHSQFHLKYEGGWSEDVEDIDFITKGTVLSGKGVGSPSSAIALRVRDDQKLMWSTKYFIDHQGTNTIAFFNDIRTFEDKGKEHIAITGATSWISTTNGKSDILFSVLDEDGKPIQSSFIGTPEYDQGLIVKQIDHPKFGPGFIIVGETHPAPNPNYNWNITVSIVDINGSLKQSAEFDAAGRQKIYDVVQSEDGYILVGETSTVGKTCDGDSLAAFVLALNKKLYPDWHRVIDINPSGQFSKDAAVGVAIYDDRLWVAGYRNNSTNFVPATFLVKMDLSGNISWLYEYNVTLAQAFGQQITMSGDLENVILTLKGILAVDFNGNPSWHKNYPGNLPFLYDLAIDENGSGFGIAGKDTGPPTLHSDLYLIRTDTKGMSNTVCESDPNVVLSKPDYCLTEISLELIGSLSQKRAKLTTVDFPLTAFDCQYNAIPSLGGNAQGLLYPNPTKGYMLVGNVNVKQAVIYDITGLKIKILHPERNEIDVSELRPGTYSIHLLLDNGTIEKHTFRKE